MSKSKSGSGLYRPLRLECYVPSQIQALCGGKPEKAYRRAYNPTTVLSVAPVAERLPGVSVVCFKDNTFTYVKGECEAVTAAWQLALAGGALAPCEWTDTATEPPARDVPGQTFLPMMGVSL